MWEKRTPLFGGTEYAARQDRTVLTVEYERPYWVGNVTVAGRSVIQSFRMKTKEGAQAKAIEIARLFKAWKA